MNLYEHAYHTTKFVQQAGQVSLVLALIWILPCDASQVQDKYFRYILTNIAVNAFPVVSGKIKKPPTPPPPQLFGSTQRSFKERVILFRVVPGSCKKKVWRNYCERGMIAAYFLTMCLQGVVTRFSFNFVALSRKFPHKWKFLKICYGPGRQAINQTEL